MSPNQIASNIAKVRKITNPQALQSDASSIKESILQKMKVNIQSDFIAGKLKRHI